MVNMKDGLNRDRFVRASLDNMPRQQKRSSITKSPAEEVKGLRGWDADICDNTSNYDYRFANQEYINMSSKHGGKGIAEFPAPLNPEMWTEPNATAFRVRGKTYKKDKIKINAGESLFRLICVDLVEVESPIMTGMCLHPKERFQQSLAKGANGDCPPFVIAINIVLPGPPFYHLVVYYAVDDIKQINGKDGTPFSKLANKFFFGDSDEFRHSTFKLIPQIMQGNWLVRRAVGKTPTIIGRKLTQTYVTGERFFELVLDVGSSSVAAGVVRLCLGYAKKLVTDIAFLLEGNNESTLPERVMGRVRLNEADLSNLRFVEQVDNCGVN